MKYDYIECGDCLELMKEIPDKSIDLIVTDPPYLISYKTKYRKEKTHKFCTEIKGDDDEELIRNYMSECFRILKDNSAMYCFCSAKTLSTFTSISESTGFKIKNGFKKRN